MTSIDDQMAMVGVVSGSLQADSRPKSSGLVLGRRPLRSSNEPSELSQWLCHDDSTINIVLELLLLIGRTQSWILGMTLPCAPLMAVGAYRVYLSGDILLD